MFASTTITIEDLLDRTAPASASLSSPRRPTLRTLVTALGEPLLQAALAPSGLDVAAGLPVVHDPAEELPEEPDGILLLVGGHPAALATTEVIRAAAAAGYAAVVAKLRHSGTQTLVEAAAAAGIALLVVPDEVPWRRLEGLLVTALGGVAATDPALGIGASDGFALANAIATAVGGAVAIEDAAQNVVAYSTLRSQPIDEIRAQGILARRIPDLPKHEAQYARLLATSGVVHYPSDPSDGELPRAAIAVRAGNEVLGSIWVIEGPAPRSPDADAALEEASGIAALYLLRSRTAADLERHARGELLRALLEGQGQAAAAAEQLGLSRNRPFMLLALDLPARDGAAPAPVGHRLGAEVARYCAAFRTGHASVMLGRVVYAFIPLVRDAAAAMRIARGVASHTEAALRRPVCVAVSGIATDPLAAPRLRREVDGILRVLASDSSAPTVAASADVASRIALVRLADTLRLEPELRHPGVRAMLDHDRRRGTAYGETLLAHLTEMGDTAAVARMLRVHPNTVRYRLRRAAAAFGLPLADPDERLRVWLELRISLTTAASRDP